MFFIEYIIAYEKIDAVINPSTTHSTIASLLNCTTTRYLFLLTGHVAAAGDETAFRNARQRVMQCDVKLETVGRADALQKLCSTLDMATIGGICSWKFHPTRHRGNDCARPTFRKIQFTPYLSWYLAPRPTPWHPPETNK